MVNNGKIHRCRKKYKISKKVVDKQNRAWYTGKAFTKEGIKKDKNKQKKKEIEKNEKSC